MIEFSNVTIPDGIKKSHLRDAVSLLRNDSRNKVPFGKIHLMFYIDLFGDFFEKKGPMGRLCQAIYDSLDSEDKMAVMEYLMEEDEE